MLSNTWEKRQDPQRRRNLFRSISQVMKATARVPLPRIGSFVIDDKGLLSLNNRPLPIGRQESENGKIPIDIPRDTTYPSVDAYVVDTLAIHESRLQHQLNGAINEEDCVYQTCALTVMKAISTRFFRRDLRYGPFTLCLTDPHQSNILVDADWNITCLIDLEWACSGPVETRHPPQWPTSRSIDNMTAAEYTKMHREFMDAFETEEILLSGSTTLTSILREGREKGTFGYMLALSSLSGTSGLFKVFYQHISTRFAKGHEDNESFYLILMNSWAENACGLVMEKVKDKAEYNERLRAAVDDDQPTTENGMSKRQTQNHLASSSASKASMKHHFFPSFSELP